MTPLLPTDETPSAGARARAKKLFARFVYDDDDALGGEVTFSRSAMKQLRKDSALALDAYAKDHAREHLTGLDCPLCHCCGEKRHDGGDPCVSCESTAREREAEVWEEAAIRAHDMAIMAKAAGDIQGYYAASTLYDSYSARAAEARRTG